MFRISKPDVSVLVVAVYNKSDSTKPNGPVSETGGSGIFWNSDESSKITMTDPDD
jgi:hypothetical protein